MTGQWKHMLSIICIMHYNVRKGSFDALPIWTASFEKLDMKFMGNRQAPIRTHNEVHFSQQLDPGASFTDDEAKYP